MDEVRDDPVCDICEGIHPDLVPGKTYRIDASDCCLRFEGLIATFVGFDSEDHDMLLFDDGSLRVGYSWHASGWDIEEIA